MPDQEITREGTREADHDAARKALTKSKQVVVKIGSKSLDGDAWVRLGDDVGAQRSAAKKAAARAAIDRW
jgi:uncharacterized protein YhdP